MDVFPFDFLWCLKKNLVLFNLVLDFGIDSPISPSAAAVEQPSSKTHGE